MARLIKVELMRFFHSLEIIKYAFIVGLIVFFLPAVDFLNLDSEQLTDEVVWSGVSVVSLYAVVVCAAVIGSYIGREFSQKTLYYEVMRGYRPLQICISKMITSGVLISIILAVAMLIYFITFSVTMDSEFWVRFFFMWVLLLHIACCATLYILLAQNGIIGGCIVFVRFVLLETAVMSGLLMVPREASKVIAALLTTKQWVTIANNAFDHLNMWGIILVTIVESLVLLVMVHIRMTKRDLP